MAVKSSDPIDILLEMGIDLDNLSEEEDYLSALKEAIAIILVKTKGAGDEKSKVLLDEVIKVRKSRKAADPKFKAKKTTIKPDAFFDKKKPDEQEKPVPGQKALPGTVGSGAIIKAKEIEPPDIEPEKKEEKDTKLLPGGDPLKDILKGVNSIIEILKKQQKLSTKQTEKDRKRAEKQKRSGQEDKLEKSGVKNFISGVGKVLKPVKGLLSGIFDFIKNILIGAVLIKILNWFTDPDNKEKIDALGNFFKNTWPLLLAAYLLFGNSIGRFAVKLIKVVGGFGFKLLRKLIPALLKGVARLGFGKSLALGGLAVGGTMLLGRMMGGEDDDDTKPAPESPSGEGEPETKKQVAGQDYDPKNPTDLQKKALDLKDQINAKGGGIVPGSGPNKDTVPAMLAPGEFVMSRGAVSKYGADTMASMNSMGGGTNRPMIKDGVTYAKTGGSILGPMPKSTVEKPHTENTQEPKEDSKTDGGFLSGITGGIKSLFGGGGGGDDKDAPKQSETKEDSSSGDGGFNESSLKAAMDKAGYTDPTERAMFLAQMAHESGNFRYDEEIHDGSNYEGRSDLGNTQPGDGKRYKGRGYIQLTGRANYTHYGSKLGVDLAGKPELAKRPDIAADVAVAYWNERVDRAAAVKGDVRTVTRNINGGYNGLQDRIDKFKKYSGNPNYTAPGGGLIASSSSSGSGELTSGSGGGSSKPVASYDELVANFRSSGGSPSKSMSKPSGGSPPGPPVSAFQALQTGFGGPGGGSGSSSASGGQQSSGNSSNAMTSSGNTFPEIDANAAVSPDKIKVLGLTIA